MKIDKSVLKWDRLTEIPVDSLNIVREQLHHAVQLIAAAGKYLVPEQPDDSHTTLDWNTELNSFEGKMIMGKNPLRIGFQPSDFSYYTRIDDNDVSQQYKLLNNTMDQAFFWLRGQLENFSIDVSELSLKMHYEIPSKIITSDYVFETINPGEIEQFCRYFANAHFLLNEIRQLLPDASEVRCWPHHFDIATLYTIDKDRSAEDARSIGIGFAPGDEGYEEPYFYLTPWPYPELEKIALPNLAAGSWHTQDWVGAILKASDIYPSNDQASLVTEFINSSVPACASLLNHHF